MEDAQLVAAVRSGDTAAFGALYDRYSDPLYDFARGILRNSEDAMDAVQDTFITASTRLDQLRDPAKVRPWLYSVTRSHAYRQLRARKRDGGTLDEEQVIDLSSSPDSAVLAAEMQQLLSDASLGLSAQDQQLIDLHLRHDMPVSEIASALGIRTSQASVRLTRVKDRVERCLGALLVARQGSEDCIDLQDILVGWDGRFNPLIRKRVARHIDDCDICDATKAAVASPLALLSALPIVAAPALLRDTVLAEVSLISSSRAVETSTGGAGQSATSHNSAAKVSFRPGGFAAMPGEMARKAAFLAIGVATIMMLSFGGVRLAQEDVIPVVAVQSTTTAGEGSDTIEGSATTLGSEAQAETSQQQSTSSSPPEGSTSTAGASSSPSGTTSGTDTAVTAAGAPDSPTTATAPVTEAPATTTGVSTSTVQTDEPTSSVSTTTQSRQQSPATTTTTDASTSTQETSTSTQGEPTPSSSTTSSTTTTTQKTTTTASASLYFKPSAITATEPNDYCGKFVVGYNGPVTATISFKSSGTVGLEVPQGSLKSGESMTINFCVSSQKFGAKYNVSAFATTKAGISLASASMTITLG